MGWQITCLENTLHIDEACAKDLFKEGDGEFFYGLEDVWYGGRVRFNSDHMEHADWLSRDAMQAVLKLHKARGRVLWMCADGVGERL